MPSLTGWKPIPTSRSFSGGCLCGGGFPRPPPFSMRDEKLDSSSMFFKLCQKPKKLVLLLASRQRCTRDYEPIPDTLYRNNGDGTFTDVSEASGVSRDAGTGMGTVCADYDDDGDVEDIRATSARACTSGSVTANTSTASRIAGLAAAWMCSIVSMRIG